MVTKFRQLLAGSKPVVIVTALVAVLGMTGTAYSAKLITGLDVRDGSLTAADLSKPAQAALHGSKGDKGTKGIKGELGAQGAKGVKGELGAQGASGGFGQTGAQGPAGPQGPIGIQGPTGNTGTGSTVAGPQGPSGSIEGAVCTVPGGHSGTIHWIDESGGAGTAYGLHCVGVV